MVVDQIINTDCILGLQGLPDKSVNCCVTSPPYYGFRDYGYDGQIGLEEKPEAYVHKLVDVFREVRRTLKDDGTLWLNLGDTYYNYRGQNDYQLKQTISKNNAHLMNTGSGKRNVKNDNLKGKDLIGIPWMVAFALRADGWYLRQDIIWHKPNPMPESVTDRCTKSHEYIFLLSKSAKYYYDHEAIRQKGVATSSGSHQRDTSITHGRGSTNSGINKAKEKLKLQLLNGEEITANKRSVWTVTTNPFQGAHFATFPQELIVDCIKAGCPEGGLVLDPFMGAGTTAVVAKKLNRNYIGFELNPEYIGIAKNRLQNEIGIWQ